MARNDNKNNDTGNPVAIESGWGTFLLVWAKAGAITVATVLILKYIFKVPIAI